MDLPRRIQFEPVGQCNLQCRMCPVQFREDGPPYGPPAFLKFDDFARLLDGFPDATELQLQGLGEPMMHPKLFDMIAHATARGVRVSMNTNLTLLSPRRAELCVTSGLSEMHISIDGASAATYEAIRVGARFARVIDNLELLQRTRERPGGGPRLRLVAVAMRRNLGELPDLVRLARRHGIEAMFVQHLCHDFGESSLPAHYRPMREYVQAETLLEEDLGRVEASFAEARAAADALGVDLRLPNVRPRAHPPGTPGRARCDWPWTGAYVSYQGLAMPCCMVATPDRVHFGDMLEQGVREVWDGPAYNDFRDRLDSDDPPEICRSCSVFQRTF